MRMFFYVLLLSNFVCAMDSDSSSQIRRRKHRHHSVHHHANNVSAPAHPAPAPPASSRDESQLSDRSMSYVWATKITQHDLTIQRLLREIAELKKEREEHSGRIHDLYQHILRLTQQLNRHEHVMHNLQASFDVPEQDDAEGDDDQ